LEYPLLQQHQINQYNKIVEIYLLNQLHSKEQIHNKIVEIYLLNQLHSKEQIPYNKIVIETDQLLKVKVKYLKFG